MLSAQRKGRGNFEGRTRGEKGGLKKVGEPATDAQMPESGR